MKRVIKYAAVLFALVLSVSIIGSCLMAGVKLVQRLVATSEGTEEYKDIWYRKENGDIVFLGITIGSRSDGKSGMESFAAADVHSLYLEGGHGFMEVQEWQQDYFSVEYENIPDDYEIYNDAGILTIVREKAVFSLGVTFDKPSKIYVRVPEGTVLKTAEVSNASGSMTITGISAEKLFVDKGSGSADISGITAKNSVFDSGSGSINVRDSSLGVTEVDSGSGGVNLENVVAENLVLDSGSGRVDISGELTGKCLFDSGSGSVNIVIYGEEENYNISTDIGSGSFYLNGRKEKEEKIEYRGAENLLVFDAGSGRVSLEFAE